MEREGRPLLLLVEDDDNEVTIAMRALRRDAPEVEVRVLRDGARALDYLDDPEAPLPRAVLLDLNMPRVDGFSVLRELRRREAWRHVPVVVVSSSSRDEDVRRSYELGANSFVTRRFDPERPGRYFSEVSRYWIETNRVVS
jgi:CheY-like chemotaxis protein